MRVLLFMRNPRLSTIRVGVRASWTTAESLTLRHLQPTPPFMALACFFMVSNLYIQLLLHLLKDWFSTIKPKQWARKGDL